MAGGLGGLGGFDIGNVLGALGQALLSSPRENPFQTLPQTMAASNQLARQQQSDAALALALTKAGVDPQTAATLALNPTAASLMISQQNLQRQLGVGADLNKAIGAAYGLPGAAAPTAPATPAAPSGPVAPSLSTGGLGGLGGFEPSGARTMAMPGPEVNPFLRLVMGAEGTDPASNPRARGFNTTLGYDAFTGGPQNLTGMTVDQVLNMQKGMLAHPDNSYNSSAAGGFQVVGDTLRRLREQGVVKGNDLFDASTQTKIATALAQGRGRDVEGLRAEWQGLRNVPDDQILAAYDASFGGGANAGAGTGAPAGTLPTQPYQVAAAGGKIPVPIPENAVKPLAESGYGPDTKTMRALAQRKLVTGMQAIIQSAAMGEFGKPYAEAGKLMVQDAQKYLEPTETEKALSAAGIDPRSPQGQEILRAAADKRPEPIRLAEFAAGGSPTEPPDVRRARELVGQGLPDTRPKEVQLGEAFQDTPGKVRAGIEAAAAAKGAETAATSQATKRAEFSAEATAGAQAADRLADVVNTAERHLEKVVKLGGYGPIVASTPSRVFNKYIPDIPGLTTGHAAEVERQGFDQAMATLGAARAAAVNKSQGGGNMSATEQVLARSDLAKLTNADPEIAREAFRQLRTDIKRAKELDQKYGLFQGEQQRAAPPVIQTPYGTLREKR